IHFRLLAPGHRLVFCRADGGLSAVSFRIRARARRESFAALLQKNRHEAAGLAPSSPLPAQPPATLRDRALPLVGLGVYLVGFCLIAPLWQMFHAPPVPTVQRPVFTPVLPQVRPGRLPPAPQRGVPRPVVLPPAPVTSPELLPFSLAQAGRYLVRGGVILV